jgi:hypothetical protein
MQNSRRVVAGVANPSRTLLNLVFVVRKCNKSETTLRMSCEYRANVAIYWQFRNYVMRLLHDMHIYMRLLHDIRASVSRQSQ